MEKLKSQQRVKSKGLVAAGLPLRVKAANLYIYTINTSHMH